MSAALAAFGVEQMKTLDLDPPQHHECWGVPDAENYLQTHVSKRSEIVLPSVEGSALADVYNVSYQMAHNFLR